MSLNWNAFSALFDDVNAFKAFLGMEKWNRNWNWLSPSYFVSESQEIIVSIQNVIVAHLESRSLCTSKRVQVRLKISRQQLELTADSNSVIIYSGHHLSVLEEAINESVDTYLGGIPGKTCSY